MDKPKAKTSTRKNPAKSTSDVGEKTTKPTAAKSAATKPAASKTPADDDPKPAPEQSQEEPAEKPAAKPARVKPPTTIEIAMAKYTAAGWTIIKPPRGAVNDFMASRGARFHFVQVVTKSTIDDPKFHGEAKNSFVQNAFSNGAVPIFAHVVEGSSPKVTFEDVNTGDRVIVTAARKRPE